MLQLSEAYGRIPIMKIEVIEKFPYRFCMRLCALFYRFEVRTLAAV